MLAFTVTAQSRPNARAHHFLVVFSFLSLRYFAAVGSVDPASSAAASVARILARTHLGMAAAERSDLLSKFDRRDRPIGSTAGGANVNTTGRNRSGVELQWLACSPRLLRPGPLSTTTGSKRISFLRLRGAVLHPTLESNGLGQHPLATRSTRLGLGLLAPRT